MCPLKIKVGVTGHSSPLSPFFQNRKCSLYLLKSKQLFEQKKDTYASWQSFFKIKKSQTKSTFLYLYLQWGNNHTKHLLPGLIDSLNLDFNLLTSSSSLSDFNLSVLVFSRKRFSCSLIGIWQFQSLFSNSTTCACKLVSALVSDSNSFFFAAVVISFLF